MASSTQDDAFHEIQLNGKQLFFLFMAATVVSVVIFLCGVLVGRGVQAERRTMADSEAMSASPSPDIFPVGTTETSPPGMTAGADPTIVPPPPPAEEIAEVGPNSSLGDPEPPPAPKAAAPKPGANVSAEKPTVAAPKPAETARTAPTTTTATTPKAEPTPKPAAPRPAAAPPAAASAASSSGTGSDKWVVQVAALNTRGDADGYAKNLSAKGYSAYVVPPATGTSVYRVRVGGFKNKQDANAVAEKLRREMKLKPWVTTG